MFAKKLTELVNESVVKSSGGMSVVTIIIVVEMECIIDSCNKSSEDITVEAVAVSPSNAAADKIAATRPMKLTPGFFSGRRMPPKCDSEMVSEPCDPWPGVCFVFMVACLLMVSRANSRVIARNLIAEPFTEVSSRSVHEESGKS